MAKAKLITHAPSEAAYWAAQSKDFDAVVTDAGASLVGSSRVTLKFTRTAPGTLGEDQAMTHFWFSKIAGGNLFAYVPTSELPTIETALDTMMTALAPKIADDFKLVEYAWHHFHANLPRTDDSRGQKPGPAVRVTVKNTPGTDASSTLPHQVAMNVTLRTTSRKHWGRSCFPGLTNGGLTGDYGRWSTTWVDAFANAVNTLHDSMQTATYQMGVWSQLHPAFLTPTTIEADDVPDIQRRRRAKRTNYRKLLT